MSHKLEAGRDLGKRDSLGKRESPTTAQGDLDLVHPAIASAPPRVKGPNFPVSMREGWRVVVIVGFVACRITCVGAFGIQWHLRAGFSFL